MKKELLINPFYYSIPTRVRDKAFLEMLQPSKGDKILNVGCGLGYFTDLLASKDALVDAVDIDKDCIEYCQKHMKGRYKVADIHKLPLTDKYYDKALCTEVLEHTNNNKIVLDEINRIIKKGGTLVVSVPCNEGIFSSHFKNIGHNNVNENSHEYHWHKGYTKNEIIDILKQSGFIYKSHCYTLIAFAEIFTGLSKIVVKVLQAKKIDSQANALLIKDKWLWKIYKKLFPIIWWLVKLEQPLSKVIKGHMIIIQAEKE